jgi:diketogulonate reductase-like aldo/keto reductase
MYGNAEDITGAAIEGRRDGVFLVSKVLPQNGTASAMKAACERSLKKLKTDRLDCYLLHWRGTTPLEETVKGFEDLLAEGKILSWGVSNFDAKDLDELLAIESRFGLKMACNQVLYHLNERAVEWSVVPWCEHNSVAVTAYSPFGQGDFPSPETPGGKVLAEIANAHSATPRQIALAFLTRHPSMFAIPKASNPDHVAENAGAGDIVLTSKEIEAIGAAFPKKPEPPSLPML